MGDAGFPSYTAFAGRSPRSSEYPSISDSSYIDERERDGLHHANAFAGSSNDQQAGSGVTMRKSCQHCR